jgi:hypothetical protein
MKTYGCHDLVTKSGRENIYEEDNYVVIFTAFMYGSLQSAKRIRQEATDSQIRQQS